ncbi:MAG: hypothetical protein HRT95_11230 [Moritella sp.]|uniref:hypothetical protein n=1 Tax=Moritella sp. TaxID=78556 RepID=UPI001DDAE455|nr:hypothetical protein [Moritella sp.]NQZ50718.1 hypothetical protein [Moritella sp.]
MKFFVITLGIATSIFIYGGWLTLDNEWWRELFFSLFKVKELNEYLGVALYLFWLKLPLMAIFTLACAVTINRLGYPRYFIYSVLLTSFFTFAVLPILPVFDVLLAGLMSSFRFIDIFVIMLMFLTLFVVFKQLTRNITSP